MAGYQQEGLFAGEIEALQVNTGLVCNHACSYCFQGCSPERGEIMSWPLMKKVLRAAETIGPRLIDLTGGAPELNPHIRRFIAALRDRRFRVQLRTNLTVMAEPDMEDMPGFLCENDVNLVAAQPCHLEENICSQKGAGVFEKSILALKRLNQAGYTINPELQLNLVYNPGGTALPGRQSTTRAAYRRELYQQQNISFSRFLSITDMPMGRYRAMGRREGRAAQYAGLLRKAFDPGALELLMCRHQVSISWDGVFHDCDFNLALGKVVDGTTASRLDDDDLSSLAGRRIITDDHCFGCTAGYGLPCNGLLQGSAS